MNRAHRFILVALAAAATAVLADIAASGPYYIDLESYEPCDDFGSLGITFDVRLTTNADDQTVHEGNITFPYDVDDPDITSSFIIDRWGSTGGWSRMYNLTEKDIFNYLDINFPNVFKLYFGAMGITGHPAPAGTYLMKNFMPTNVKLQKMETLLYGRYKVQFLQFKDDENLGCVQAVVSVKEEGKDASGDAAKKKSPQFG